MSEQTRAASRDPSPSSGQTTLEFFTLQAALVVTMVASTVQLFVVAVAASDIIADLDISRTALGLATALNTLVGALVAPRIGKLTDRIGSRASLLAVLGISALGLAVTAASTSIWILAVGSAISGIPDGWGNPATNKLIADRVPAGRRGRVIGIKQSGVQLAVFVTGISLPSLSSWASWRTGTLIYAIAIASIAIVVALLLPRMSHAERADIAEGRRELNAAEKSMAIRLGIFALLLGIGAGGFGRWLPLFGEEVLGMSNRRAGFVVAVMGVVGIGARILWGSWAEHRIRPLAALRILGWGSVFTFALTAATPSLGANVLWIAAIAAAFTVNAWNAVAMLAVITSVPPSLAGQASGPVLLGFLGGLSVGTPAAGWLIDRSDDYRPVWICAAVLAAIGALLVNAAPRSPRPESRHADIT